MINPCKLILKPKEELRIQQGHPWVYNNEIDRIEGNIQSGEIAYAYSSKKRIYWKRLLEHNI